MSECDHKVELDCTLYNNERSAVFSCSACGAEVKRMPFTMKDGKPVIQVRAGNLPWRAIVGTVE